MVKAQVGYQPRNTPAERRAFFDQQRQLTRQLGQQAEEAEDLYVSITGDHMTGRLHVDDVTPVLNGGGISVGVVNGRRLRFDENEIGVYNADGSPDTLSINLNGGAITLGSSGGAGVSAMNQMAINAAAPTVASHATRKDYVDGLVNRATANITPAANWDPTTFANHVTRVGGIAVLEVAITRLNSTATPPGIVGTIPAGFRPALTTRAAGMSGATLCALQVHTNGDINFFSTGVTAAIGGVVFANISYRVA